MESWVGGVRSEGSGVRLTSEAKWALGAVEPGAGYAGRASIGDGKRGEGVGGGGNCRVGRKKRPRPEKGGALLGAGLTVAGCKCARNPAPRRESRGTPIVFPRPHRLPEPQRPHPLPSIPPHPPPAGGLRRLSLPRSLCSSSILLPRASGGSETYNPTRPPTRTSSRGLQTPPLPTLPSAISPL